MTKCQVIIENILLTKWNNNVIINLEGSDSK